MRQRMATDSATVPATTKNAIATMSTATVRRQLKQAELVEADGEVLSLADLRRPETVRSEPPSTAWTRPASVAADTPGRATIPIRSACPGWPYSAAAWGSERNTVQFPAGLPPPPRPRRRP